MKPKKTPQAKTSWVKRVAAVAVMAGGVLMFAQPAHADSLSIALNVGDGGPRYYHAEPVRHVVYRPAPVQHVVYRPVPVRVVYQDVHRGRGHGRDHGRWERGWDRGHRVAYGYR